MSKFYTEQKHKENMNNVDMLKGCINRMCVTDDVEECDRMFSSAILDLAECYQTNKERILEKRYGDKETREENHRKALDLLFDKTIDDETRKHKLAELGFGETNE